MEDISAGPSCAKSRPLTSSCQANHLGLRRSAPRVLPSASKLARFLPLQASCGVRLSLGLRAARKCSASETINEVSRGCRPIQHDFPLIVDRSFSGNRGCTRGLCQQGG